MHPTPALRDPAGMVTHVAYIELHPADAAECLDMIRERVDLGWQLCRVRGPRSGPYTVLLRMDEAAKPATGRLFAIR